MLKQEFIDLFVLGQSFDLDVFLLLFHVYLNMKTSLC